MMDNGEMLREQAVFAYMARYGQQPSTEQKYRPAIEACQNINFLPLTVSDIARKYDLNPECLRNQLKRHFPEILEKRTQLRAKMGYKESCNFGLKNSTVLRYAAAVEMLRDPRMTVREAATLSAVSYQGLQQHLLFYHKDIAESRMLARTDALLRPVVEGEMTASGSTHAPSAKAKALYGPAVELYRTTDLPMTEIAARCGLKVHNLSSYIRKWHRPEMERRQKARKARVASKREAYARREDLSAVTLARKRYTPAITLLQSGLTLSQAAKELDVDLTNLASWFKRNHPDILEQTHAGMMILPGGRKALRRTYEKYHPIAQYMDAHLSQPTREVARRFCVPLSSLTKKMNAIFPDIWKRHCDACRRTAKRPCSP